MNGFSFSRIPELIFGAGKLSLLPGIVNKYGKHLLIVAGKGSFTQTAYATLLFENLAKAGFSWSMYTVSHEPSAEDIDLAVELFKHDRCDVVVAIGGGSVLDAGKAISAMLVTEGSIVNYLEGVGNTTPPGNKVPFVAVPTTAGTGSEATKNAVITKVGENGFKSSLRHNNYIPDLALIDPELQLQCPVRQTACSGMDAFTQLLESYLSTQANPVTDALALEGIRAINDSLVRVVTDPENIDLRSKMAYAAWLSGITLANAGLGTVHGFAGAIGAMFDIPHGIVCGTMMAEVNRMTFKRLTGAENEMYFVKKYGTIGRIIAEKGEQSERYYAELFIDYLSGMTEILKIPRLSAYGITSDFFNTIASKTSNKNNPVKLSKEDMVEILGRRL